MMGSAFYFQFTRTVHTKCICAEVDPPIFIGPGDTHFDDFLFTIYAV